ncbi:MAG: MerR family transcriptional regulator [Chloroflexi bacterium]|nr:MerR family transcriptional regulator [Chloroflexota bacterium]
MRETDALYIISVAARLVNLHPNTLRKYEREGFLEPSRLGGKLRLYSAENIARLRQIRYLAEERGLNLAGIDLALELTNRIRGIQALLDQGDGVELNRRVRIALAEMLEVLGTDGCHHGS